MRSKPFCVLLLSIALAGCAHTERRERFEKAIEAGRCEDALAEIPENDPSLHWQGAVDRASGRVISYTATGVGYTADAVILVAGGTVLLVTFCSPALAVMALSAAAHSPPPRMENGGCLPFFPKSVMKLPHFGQDIYESTEEMRCPDLTSLARSVRKVAACQEREGDGSLEAKKRARVTLGSIAGSENVITCIAREERMGIWADIRRLDAILGTAEP